MTDILSLFNVAKPVALHGWRQNGALVKGVKVGKIPSQAKLVNFYTLKKE